MSKTFMQLEPQERERFYSTAGVYVDDGKDNPFPWAAPWLWCQWDEIPPGDTVEDSAKQWIKQNAEEILRLERDRLDFIKEDGELNSAAADDLIFKIQLLEMLKAE